MTQTNSRASRAPRHLAWLALLLAQLIGACTDAPSDGAPPSSSGPRVVPASAGILDMLVDLLPPESLAGIPEQAIVYSSLRDADSPFLARPRFERYVAESVLALEPKLVLAQPWQFPETTSRLREAGVTVQLLGVANTWEEVRAQLLQVAEWVDASEAGERVAAAYDARVVTLRELAAADATTLSALSYGHLGGQGRVAAADTTGDAVLRLAGLRNLAAEQGLVGHQNYDMEQLLSADPDVLVVGSGNDGSPGETVSMLRSDPRLASLRAVQDERILILEPWLNVTTSQHLVAAAERLREQVQHALSDER